MNDDRQIPPYEARLVPAAERERRRAESWPEVHGETEETEPIPWRRYVAALFRYKWVIALALLLGFGGAYVAWNTIEPSYVAQGSLWIRSDDGSTEQGPITTGGLLESSAWVELLNSYSVLDSVVQEEKLYLRPARPQDFAIFAGFDLEPDFTPGSYLLRVAPNGRSAELVRAGSTVDAAAAGQPLGVPVGFRWSLPESGLPAGQDIPFSVVRPREAATRLRADLSTRADQGGNFLRIELRGTNPERIAGVLNAVLERQVDVAATLKSGNLRERREALADQLANVEDELRTAERNLEEFRVRTITLPSEGSTSIQPGLEVTRDPVLSSYFQMQVDLEGLRRERERLRDILNRAAEGELSLEMLDLVPTAADASELQSAMADLRSARVERRELLQRYTPEHPPVQELSQKIRELESDVVPVLVQELIRGLGVEEAALAARIDSAGSDLTEIPPRAIEEARLRRRVAMAEQLYQEVRSRYETTNLAEASTIPDLRLLDRAAVPEEPANDQRIRFAGTILLGAFGLGIMGALVLDRFDPRIRYPDEVERRFGFPFLGVIPTISRSNGKSKEGSFETYEAFRGLRTNLTYAYGSANPLIFAVSSPGQGDGKSLVSANLAMAFAHLGQKTLLIDGDTRKGYLHRILGVERKPGLTDFLVSDGPPNGNRPSGIAKETAHPDLDLIPSGSRLSNSPELLSSRRLADALADFKARYDVIVVDTPPLGAGSDAALLSCITGHLLLVLRSGSTNKEFTRAKIEPLRRLPVRVLGVVLNDYTARGVGAYSYYGNYLPGYETGREEGVQGKTVVAPHEGLRIPAELG